MKNCNACGNIQEAGNYCGKCGASLYEVNDSVQGTAATDTAFIPTEGPSEQTYSPPPVHTQPSVHVEKIKAQSKMYGSYFINYLKNPVSVLSTGSREFINGIISIVLFAIIISLSIYSLLGGLMDLYLGDISSLFSMEKHVGPSFFSTFFSTLIIMLVLITISLVSMFIVVKVFGPGYSFTELVAFYGVHLLPLMVISFVALILLLLKSFTFGSFLITVSLIVALSLIPLYLVSRILAFQPKSIDPLYSYLIYIVLSVVLFSIVTFVVADTTFGQIMSEILEYTEYY